MTASTGLIDPSGAGDGGPVTRRRWWEPRHHGLIVDRHRATTRNLATAYPFHTGPGPSTAGPYLGVNVTGGGSGWYFDPFELYADASQPISDSNVLIAGRPGKGKSTGAKTFLYREIGLYGRRRFIAVNDPKGEYTPLADALGLTVIKLHPGGQHRLNPLDAAPGDRSGGLLGRQRLVTSMLSIVLDRRLEPSEEALISRAIEHLAAKVLTFDLADLAHLIAEPPEVLVAHPELAGMTAGELRAAATPLRFALGKLLDRTLRGMFDGYTTAAIDWVNSAGVVIDLSAVFADREALPLVMMAAGAWLQSALTALGPDRRALQVDDEVWALLENEWAVKHLQARLKLCRHWGICNVLICHKLSDLSAQAADGTAAAKVAAGLLAEIGTRIVFAQPHDQAGYTADLLGLSAIETALLPRLVKGRALWRVGERAAVVQHVVAPGETFCNTDQSMRA